MAGWVKVHRKLLEWGWYSDSHMVHLFLHLLLEANHEKKVWRGVEIMPGQLIFGRKAFSERLGISERSIRTCMERLKTTNELTIKTTSRFSLVTIVKWEEYQSEEKKRPAKRPAKRHTNDQQTTTPKEVKNNTTNVVFSHPLCSWIKNTLPTVSKMRDQLTDEQAKNLLEKYDKKLIRDVLESMENYVPLLKKSKSVNLTVQNWIKRREQKEPGTTKIKDQKMDYSAQDDFYSSFQSPLKAIS